MVFFKRAVKTSDISPVAMRAQQEEEGRQNARKITEVLELCFAQKTLVDAKGRSETSFYYIPIVLRKRPGELEINKFREAVLLDRAYRTIEEAGLRDVLCERVNSVLHPDGSTAEKGAYDLNYPSVHLTWPMAPGTGIALVVFESPPRRDTDTELWKAAVTQATVGATFKFIVEMQRDLNLDMEALKDSEKMNGFLNAVYRSGTYSVPINIFPRDKPSRSVYPSAMMGLKSARE